MIDIYLQEKDPNKLMVINSEGVPILQYHIWRSASFVCLMVFPSIIL